MTAVPLAAQDRLLIERTQEAATAAATQCSSTLEAIKNFKFPVQRTLENIVFTGSIDHDMLITAGWGLFAVVAIGLIYYFAKGAIAAA